MAWVAFCQNTLVDRVHRHGTEESVGIFGFDHDGPAIFNQTADVLEDAQVDSTRFGILTPMPRTHVFAQLHREERITSPDRTHFDGIHTAISPAAVSASQLQNGVAHADRRWSSTRARRFHRQSCWLSLRLAGAPLISSRRYALGEEVIRSRPERAEFSPHPDDIDALVVASEAPAQQAISVAASSASERLVDIVRPERSP